MAGTSKTAALAVEHISGRVADALDGDARVHERDAETYEDGATGRKYLQHRLTVLVKARDIVVFFDSEGHLLGWRDDQRTGEPGAILIDRDDFLEFIVKELGLAKGTRLGKLEAVELPPVGWTQEAVLFEKRPPEPSDIVRVWFNPKTSKVIQWLRDQGRDPIVTGDGGFEGAAGTVARDEFRRRLKRLALTGQPDWHFEVEAGAPEPYDGGMQVRVATWRHWSDAWVTIDPSDGSVVADTIDRFAEPAAAERMDQDQAVAAIARHITIPDDAVVISHGSETYVADHQVEVVDWERRIGDMTVEGDFLNAAVHPATGRLIRFEKQWRPMTIEGARVTVSQDQAVAKVEARRGRLKLDDDLEFAEAQLAIVADRRKLRLPGGPSDRVAWILRFAADWGFADVHVDARSGAILNVRRSA